MDLANSDIKQKTFIKERGAEFFGKIRPSLILSQRLLVLQWAVITAIANRGKQFGKKFEKRKKRKCVPPGQSRQDYSYVHSWFWPPYASRALRATIPLGSLTSFYECFHCTLACARF
jgi:hypothetical protein